MMLNAKDKVHYSEWKGRNRFFLSGKLMTGSSRDTLTLGITLSIILTSIIFYNLIIVKYLNGKGFDNLPIFGNLCIAIGTFYLFKTTFTDPGVLPRGELETAEEAAEAGLPLPEMNEHNNSHEENKNLMNSSGGSNDGHHHMIEMGQHGHGHEHKHQHKHKLSIYQHRHCKTCKIMRPPKSSHCNACDNCVKGFDHHCYFVGNCIGRRNHKYFFLFLFYASLYLGFTNIVSIAGVLEAFEKEPKLPDYLFGQMECWIISVVTLTVSFLCCNPRFCEGLRQSSIALGCFFAVLGFYLACRNLNCPYYENPATFIGFIVLMLPLTIWVYINCIGTLYGISLGLTFKEQKVIEREIGCCSADHATQVSYGDRVKNVFTFFTRNNIESHVYA